jgi:hypothetical protein
MIDIPMSTAIDSAYFNSFSDAWASTLNGGVSGVFGNTVQAQISVTFAPGGGWEQPGSNTTVPLGTLNFTVIMGGTGYPQSISIQGILSSGGGGDS